MNLEPALRIIALGDSTTAGTPGWMSPLEAPPDGRGDVTSQYAYWLVKAHPDWEVFNRGINGERSDQICSRFDRDVLAAVSASHPTIGVIIAGVNDIYQGLPAERVIDNLQWMYARARDAGIAIVAGSIVPFNTATPDQNARMHRVNDWIREQAAAGGVAFADTRAAVAAPHSPDLLFESPDDLHPSPLGYRRMAEAIQGAVGKWQRANGKW